MNKRIKLKVCGLRDNVQEIAELKTDYLGFIFYEKSPRFVGEQFVMPELSADTHKVGVFVNEKVEKVIQIVRDFKLDFVQLHGSESPKYCSECRRAGIGVIKAFAMEKGFDFAQLKAYVSVVDFFLFDTKTSSYGGSGKVFEWELLANYNLEQEYFLSGGISLDNIQRLKEMDLSKVHALDVNSRFEIEPGLKDRDMLLKLQLALKNISAQKDATRIHE